MKILFTEFDLFVVICPADFDLCLDLKCWFRSSKHLVLIRPSILEIMRPGENIHRPAKDSMTYCLILLKLFVLKNLRVNLIKIKLAKKKKKTLIFIFVLLFMCHIGNVNSAIIVFQKIHALHPGHLFCIDR